MMTGVDGKESTKQEEQSVLKSSALGGLKIHEAAGLLHGRGEYQETKLKN